MASTLIPPWLQPPDIAGSYIQGLHIGASIGEEEARLQAENVRTQMEYQARAETQKQEALRQQARLQTETAYRTATLGLRQQALQDAAAVNVAKTRDAALKLADQQGFATDLKSGMSMQDALYRHPRISTPASAVAAKKSDEDLASSRLDLREKEFEFKRNKVPPPRRTGQVSTKNETGETTTTRYTFEGEPTPPVTAPASEGPVQVKSQSEYDALQPGTEYIRPDGKKYRKKGTAAAQPQDGDDS